MKVWKYCRANARDAIARGSVRLTTLAALRDREDLGPLHDPGEGIDYAYVREGPVEPGTDYLVDSMIVSTDGSPLNLRDVLLGNEAAPCWVFCTSLDPAAELNPGEYDVRFEISDILRFAKRVQIRSGGMLGDPVLGKVVYKERYREVGSQTRYGAAFVKPPSFQDEVEFRVVWPCLVRPASPSMDLIVGSVTPLLRSISLGPNGRPVG